MWTYIRNSESEFGFPSKVGRSPLKPHVHSCVQLMVVTQGARRVDIGGLDVLVEANSILIIPPDLVHAADEGGWDGFNVYIDPLSGAGREACIVRCPSFADWSAKIEKDGTGCDLSTIMALATHGHVIWSRPDLSGSCVDTVGSDVWPLSREGQIRRYRREVGMPPYAHFNAKRLDQARRRIAAGEGLASVAADLGFTDQSHLGRQFRATFGTSPGRYAKG